MQTGQLHINSKDPLRRIFMAKTKGRPAAKIAAELERRREELGMTQAEIANDAYLERSTVYRILKGYTSKPELYTLLLICKALKFKSDQIIKIVERYGYSITKADQYKGYLKILESKSMMKAEIPDWIYALNYSV